VDVAEGTLYMEYIDGVSVRDFIMNGGLEQSKGLCCNDSWKDLLAQTLAGILAKMHNLDIIHGDLTTSNVILKHSLPSDPVCT
jgi:TP53 regulating kinase-like protein